MKNYGQYCGLSRVASFLGERWSLMILRDLGVGPARFSDLQHGLPGVPTNILTTRLRELEDAGVIERQVVRGQRGVTYRLTEWGEGIRPIIDDLGAWGARRMLGPLEGEVITDRSLSAAIANGFLPGQLVREITFSMDAGIAATHGSAGTAQIIAQPGTDANSELVMQSFGGIRELMAGLVTVDDLLANGQLVTDADPALVREFFAAFAMPLDSDVATAHP